MRMVTCIDDDVDERMRMMTMMMPVDVVCSFALLPILYLYIWMWIRYARDRLPPYSTHTHTAYIRIYVYIYIPVAHSHFSPPSILCVFFLSISYALTRLCSLHLCLILFFSRFPLLSLIPLILQFSILLLFLCVECLLTPWIRLGKLFGVFVRVCVCVVCAFVCCEQTRTIQKVERGHIAALMCIILFGIYGVL